MKGYAGAQWLSLGSMQRRPSCLNCCAHSWGGSPATKTSQRPHEGHGVCVGPPAAMQCCVSHLVAGIPLRILQQIDVAVVNILVSLRHPGIIEPTPAPNAQQLLLHGGVAHTLDCCLCFQRISCRPEPKAAFTDRTVLTQACPSGRFVSLSAALLGELCGMPQNLCATPVLTSLTRTEYAACVQQVFAPNNKGVHAAASFHGRSPNLK